MEDLEDFIAGASQHPELELLSFLGGGGFGVVLLARQVSSQRRVAVKLFQRDASDPLGARRAKEEASIMQLLRHQNIIELLEVCCVGRYHCLVMELAVGGDLYQHVMARGGLPEPEAMAMFYQVLAAVSHCHAQHVAHRDLKLENLLLDSRLNVKLGDFGLSCQLAQGALVRGFCGTAAYCAPEVFERWPYDAFAADIWSLGVILFAMLAGTMPFRGRGRAELQSCIRRGCYELPCVASPGLEELLNWLLSLDPRQRLSADMARYHWWFHPLLEEAQGEEVQPVRVSEDPEAQGLPPAPSRVSLQSDCRGLEQVQPCGQSARQAVPWPHRLALVWDAPAPAAPREARSASAWFTCENLSPQGRRESATTTAAARPPALPLPVQLHLERSPGAGPAPEPVPVAAGSNSCPRSSGGPVVPEVPAASGPAASVPSEGGQGLGNRICRFLGLTHHILQAPARGPGPRLATSGHAKNKGHSAELPEGFHSLDPFVCFS